MLRRFRCAPKGIPGLPGLLVQHLYLLLRVPANEMQVAYLGPQTPPGQSRPKLPPEKAEQGSLGSPGEVEWGLGSRLPIAGIALPNLHLK